MQIQFLNLPGLAGLYFFATIVVVTGAVFWLDYGQIPGTVHQKGGPGKNTGVMEDTRLSMATPSRAERTVQG